MKIELTADKESRAEPSESEDAAQDIIDAIKADDAKALSLALERHYACCSEMGEGDEGEA